MTEQQEKIFGVFEQFVRLCEENSLQYWVCGGTLLGAVRHKGFIPWDDDIDVEMPLADYRRLLAMADRLPEGFVLQNRHTDPRCPFLFSKFCDTRQPFVSRYANAPWGVHIDVFPLIPAKPLTKRTELAFDLLLELFYVLRAKTGWRDYVPKGKAARALYRLLLRFPEGWLRRLRERAVRAIYDPEGEWLCSIGGTYHARQEFSPGVWYAGSVAVSFEGRPCAACVGWDSWLHGHYGDYMRLPDEDQRKSHHE